jgi:hypothetical protein
VEAGHLAGLERELPAASNVAGGEGADPHVESCEQTVQERNVGALVARAG